LLTPVGAPAPTGVPVSADYATRARAYVIKTGPVSLSMCVDHAGDGAAGHCPLNPPMSSQRLTP
jgi:hypothetical protein